MTKTIEACSDDEVKRYYVCYFNTSDSLQNAKKTLERRRRFPGIADEELGEIEAQLHWLATEHAKLKQRRTAFLNGLSEIEAPSNEQMAAVRKLTEKTERLTEDGAGTRMAVTLPMQALKTFSEIQV